jgi:hypothetical protein
MFVPQSFPGFCSLLDGREGIFLGWQDGVGMVAIAHPFTVPVNGVEHTLKNWTVELLE